MAESTKIFNFSSYAKRLAGASPSDAHVPRLHRWKYENVSRDTLCLGHPLFTFLYVMAISAMAREWTAFGRSFHPEGPCPLVWPTPPRRILIVWWSVPTRRSGHITAGLAPCIVLLPLSSTYVWTEGMDSNHGFHSEYFLAHYGPKESGVIARLTNLGMDRLGASTVGRFT